VPTLYRINIIILHYSVGASLNESDIIVALANYSASFNGNHATLPCPGAAPKHGVGAFSFYSRAAITRPLSIGTISVASPSLLG
jgi:hypothetical protein